MSAFDTTLILFAGAVFILVVLGFVYCFCCVSDIDDADFDEDKLKQDQSQLEYDGSMVQIMCENSRVENIDIYAKERKESILPKKS